MVGSESVNGPRMRGLGLCSLPLRARLPGSALSTAGERTSERSVVADEGRRPLKTSEGRAALQTKIQSENTKYRFTDVEVRF